MNKSSKARLVSVQPYFVMASDDICQKVLEENGILHFFSFSNKAGSDITVPLIADGCSNLIFEYKDGGVRTHFIGSTVEKRTFSVKKDAEYFGVRLMPGGESFIREIKVKDTVGKIIILDELESMKEFCALMGKQHDFDSRMKVFLDEYSKMKNKPEKNDRQAEIFSQIADLIIQRKGMIKISELENLSGYSSRYINKIFENELGMSAKQLCKSIKFQFLLGEMNRGEIESLRSISSEYDFYDQSHFIHEFKEFAGITPGEYADKVEEKKNNIRNV